MPSVRKKTNKTGQVFYEIRVSRGRGQSYLTSRWYPPEGWSQRGIDRELARQAAEFERRVRAGIVGDQGSGCRGFWNCGEQGP